MEMKLNILLDLGDGNWIDVSHDMDHCERRIFGPGWR